jgi:hypothetical protein
VNVDVRISELRRMSFFVCICAFGAYISVSFKHTTQHTHTHTLSLFYSHPHLLCICVVSVYAYIGNSVDYVEPLKTAFREKRFVIREFAYDPSKAGSLTGLIQVTKEQSLLLRNRTKIVLLVVVVMV